MQPRIESIPEKKLVGKRLRTSLAHNRTAELWKSFMPHRDEIINAAGQEVFSISVFDAGYFSVFSPLTEFDKWAAVLVSDHAPVPTGMEILTIPAGLYAVFIYKGPASAGAAFFQYIYGRWIPGSEYELDNRPHFEVLGDKYKNEHPDSEEEVWIPVRIKA